MTNWPEIPVVATLQAILEEKEKRTEIDAKSIKESLGEHLKEVILDTLKSMPQQDSPCTCEATVICSNATENSAPVHIVVIDETVHLSGLQLINQTDIQLGSNFTGCKKAEDGLCKITENYLEWIWGQKWQDADKSSGQGEGKDSLSLENSFMVCTEYGGMIYFHDNGQGVRPFIEGTQICYLSDEYLEWLETAEGLILYPYWDTEDNNAAQALHNVTLGIGVTFDDTGRNWDILKEVLNWTDEDIKEIIEGVYTGKDYSNSEFTITREQAYEMFRIVAERQYISDVNKCISAFNRQQEKMTIYSQRQLEAMFDYSYNNGLSSLEYEDGSYSPSINDENTVYYYYLRKDLTGAVDAVKRYGTDGRRRLNQMNLFFFDYKFLDFSGGKLDPLREKLGFFQGG